MTWACDPHRVPHPILEWGPDERRAAHNTAPRHRRTCATPTPLVDTIRWNERSELPGLADQDGVIRAACCEHETTNMIYENPTAALSDLSDRIIAIRDSL
jgi:hypothetical protein